MRTETLEAARERMEKYHGFSMDTVIAAVILVGLLPGSYHDGRTVYVPKSEQRYTYEYLRDKIAEATAKASF